MASHFDLIITADYPNRTAALPLLDAQGSQLAQRQTDFNSTGTCTGCSIFATTCGATSSRET